MRVLLSTYGSRGDVEPIMGLAVQVRELGAEVRVCAPPDFAEQFDRVEVPMVALGPSARELVYGGKPLTPSDAPRVAADLAGQNISLIALWSQISNTTTRSTKHNEG